MGFSQMVIGRTGDQLLTNEAGETTRCTPAQSALRIYRAAKALATEGRISAAWTYLKRLPKRSIAATAKRSRPEHADA